MELRKLIRKHTYKDFGWVDADYPTRKDFNKWADDHRNGKEDLDAPPLPDFMAQITEMYPNWADPGFKIRQKSRSRSRSNPPASFRSRCEPKLRSRTHTTPEVPGSPNKYEAPGSPMDIAYDDVDNGEM